MEDGAKQRYIGGVAGIHREIDGEKERKREIE